MTYEPPPPPPPADPVHDRPAIGAGPAPRRPVLLVGADAAMALWGVLAFVSGFLARLQESGSDVPDPASISGYALPSATLWPTIAVGALAVVGVVTRRGVRQAYLLALAGASLAVLIGEISTADDFFGDDSRGSGYWLLFVMVILQFLTAAFATLAQSGVLRLARPTRGPVPPPSWPGGGYQPAYLSGTPASGPAGTSPASWSPPVPSAPGWEPPPGSVPGYSRPAAPGSSYLSSPPGAYQPPPTTQPLDSPPPSVPPPVG